MKHHHADHERSCEQCGIAYHPPRASSRFCSTRCRMRNHRGSPQANSALRSWLIKHGFAGELEGARLSLTLPVSVVLEELSAAVAAIEARGLKSRLPAYSKEAFKAELRALRIAL